MKKILLTVTLMMVALTISAQTEEKYENVFQPHWYIQAQGGAQYTLGEIDFDKLISPNVQLSIGYQFNKSIGARLSANAWQSKAGADWCGDIYKWKWNYVAPGIDFTFNISNLFAGYNPDRVVQFTAFLGAGANIAWKNDEANDIYRYMKALEYYTPLDHYIWDGTKTRFFGRGGIQVDFRLSDAVSLGIEANANSLKDTYNSKKAGNPDWYFNVLGGLKINLGATHTKKKIEAPEPVKIVEKVVEKVVEKPVPAPAPAPGKKTIDGKFHRDIYFGYCSAVITKAESPKVKEIVDFMKQNPNMSVTLVGYADKATGTHESNARWAAKRAAVVKDALVKAGISESRIIEDSKGDLYQPYTENDKNRVTICVVE